MAIYGPFDSVIYPLIMSAVQQNDGTLNSDFTFGLPQDFIYIDVKWDSTHKWPKITLKNPNNEKIKANLQGGVGTPILGVSTNPQIIVNTGQAFTDAGVPETFWMTSDFNEPNYLGTILLPTVFPSNLWCQVRIRDSETDEYILNYDLYFNLLLKFTNGASDLLDGSEYFCKITSLFYGY